MKKQLKMLAILATAMVCFTSCGKDVDPNDPTDPTKNILSENVESGVKTLSTGETWYLSGGIHVKDGATLKIEKGVTLIAVDDSERDYILIEQGGIIDAQGTKDEPIVMTSEVKSRGAWGGIHICGKAKINVEGGTAISEIGNSPFGGNDDSDSSGVLRYIRLEYTGYTLSATSEANGVSFYGVGNGTTVEYLQAYRGKDDGFEWFGGSVNAKYMVSTECGDDSFDWTYGWRGKGQFWVVYQTGDLSSDCLIEADNNGDDNMATPVSHPTIANVTLVGNNSSDDKSGAKFREGGFIKLYNALITGKANLLLTQSDPTQNSFAQGESEFKSVLLNGSFTGGDLYSQTDFLSESSNKVDAGFSLSDNFVGTQAGGQNLSSDSFFTATDYVGAVPANNNWTAGWTK